jgi:hypothetical protein
MTHDVDDEIDEDSEVNFCIRKNQRKRKAILDSQSQGSDSEVCQGTETSSINENSGKYCSNTKYYYVRYSYTTYTTLYIVS